MKPQSSQHDPIPSEIIDTTLDLWKKGGVKHSMPVIGTSMLPLLQPGDRLVVSHGLSSIQRGDILVFRQDEQVIAHRLLRRDRSKNGRLTLFTKGDSVRQPDLPMTIDQVIGVVVAISRDGKQKRLDTRWWKWSSWIISSVILLKMWLRGKYLPSSRSKP